MIFDIFRDGVDGAPLQYLRRATPVSQNGVFYAHYGFEIAYKNRPKCARKSVKLLQEVSKKKEKGVRVEAFDTI